MYTEKIVYEYITKSLYLYNVTVYKLPNSRDNFLSNLISKSKAQVEVREESVKRKTNKW